MGPFRHDSRPAPGAQLSTTQMVYCSFRPKSARAGLALLLAVLAGVCGCTGGGPGSGGVPDLVWGRRGISDGRLQKPRAICCDKNDQLYIVDMTARIQVFDLDGHFLRQWQTPEHEHGRPTGISVAKNGNILVPDTHYFRILEYTPQGELVRMIGGKSGQGPGEFGFLTDVAEDRDGNIYVSEYGEYDRIQKFTADGAFLQQWGGHGGAPGEFLRPQSIAFDRDNLLWVADSCNHRIQVFDTTGSVVKIWGTYGERPGELSYPYGIVFDADGNLLVCEYGNHRVQKFTPDGKSLAIWGKQGREEGQTHNPWSLVLDSQGRTHLLDSNNHRVQRFRL